jgi:two-component system sensor histidine kinase AlgZ
MSDISNTTQRSITENYTHRVKIAKIFTHLIVLIIIFVLPDILFSIGHHQVAKWVYVHPLAYLLAFYLNYSYLIGKFIFEKKNIWLYILVNVGLLLVLMVAMYYIQQYIFPDAIGPHKGSFPKIKGMPLPPPPEMMHDDVSWISRRGLDIMKFLTRDGVMVILSIGLSVAMKLTENWVKWGRQQKMLLAERQENELKNLKNQLNPHFLFNTLNNIYALIGISQQKAQLAVHELSQLLRYVLYDNESREVELEKDLLFVKNYIELMRLRLTSSVKLHVSINEKEGMGKKIAPLLFISLVENAFKHGTSANQDSNIDISIHVVGEKVVCRVANSYFPKNESDKSGSGIGIANLKKQLSILYEGRHKFTTECNDNTYVANLEIDLSPKVAETDKNVK